MEPRHQSIAWPLPQKIALAGLLLFGLVAAYVIGAGQFLMNEQPSFFAPIAATAAIPVALFLAGYAFSARFRDFVLAQDLRRLTMLQAWRVVGFTFLPLYAFGHLPGLFAWPAGLGDVAVGIAAVFVIARLDRDADFASTPRFVTFHLMGLLDFAVAIGTAGLASGAFPFLTGDGVTSAAMDVWPLNIFPSFWVPAFIILHLMVLLKVRHMRRLENQPVPGTPQAA